MKMRKKITLKAVLAMVLICCIVPGSLAGCAQPDAMPVSGDSPAGLSAAIGEPAVTANSSMAPGASPDSAASGQSPAASPDSAAPGQSPAASQGSAAPAQSPAASQGGITSSRPSSPPPTTPPPTTPPPVQPPTTPPSATPDVDAPPDINIAVNSISAQRAATHVRLPVAISGESLGIATAIIELDIHPDLTLVSFDAPPGLIRTGQSVANGRVLLENISGAEFTESTIVTLLLNVSDTAAAGLKEISVVAGRTSFASTGSPSRKITFAHTSGGVNVTLP
jgi:hypothetical protein